MIRNPFLPTLRFRRWAICSIFIFFGAPAQAEFRQGHVTGVSDGDTITLLDDTQQQHKIRIAGIDAPEKKQPFGMASKQNLSALAYGKPANADCIKKDRYGRQVCKVTVEGADVGLAQIRAGMAWWYRQYAHEQSSADREEYEATEMSARTSQKGLWVEYQAVAPWEWRKVRRLENN